MPGAITVNVKVTGGLFKRNIPQTSRDALYDEVFTKLDARFQRGGRGLGAQRNTVSSTNDALQMSVATTLVSPRRTGSSWQRKQIGITKSMAPRALRKYAERIVQELSRG